MTREDGERNYRQDLLEVVASGFSGPVCAPMPGVLLEMFEVAAMEHRQRKEASDIPTRAEGTVLTPTENRSGMAWKMLRTVGAAAYAARRLGSYLGARHLPA